MIVERIDWKSQGWMEENWRYLAKVFDCSQKGESPLHRDSPFLNSWFSSINSKLQSKMFEDIK